MLWDINHVRRFSFWPWPLPPLWPWQDERAEPVRSPDSLIPWFNVTVSKDTGCGREGRWFKPQFHTCYLVVCLLGHWQVKWWPWPRTYSVWVSRSLSLAQFQSVHPKNGNNKIYLPVILRIRWGRTCDDVLRLVSPRCWLVAGPREPQKEDWGSSSDSLPNSPRCCDSLLPASASPR